MCVGTFLWKLYYSSVSCRQANGMQQMHSVIPSLHVQLQHLLIDPYGVSGGQERSTVSSRLQTGPAANSSKHRVRAGYYQYLNVVDSLEGRNLSTYSRSYCGEGRLSLNRIHVPNSAFTHQFYNYHHSKKFFWRVQFLQIGDLHHSIGFAYMHAWSCQ